MTQFARHQRLSVEDYLAAEDGPDIRHEYIDGELYAMTGASRRHGLITQTLSSLREYLLIDQNARAVEVHRREQSWRREIVTEGSIPLGCLDVELPLDTIYEDIATL